MPLASPARTVRDFVEWAKSKPGGLAYASQSLESADQLLAEMLRPQTGLPLTHVPFKGAGPAIQEINAGLTCSSAGSSRAAWR